MPPPRHCSTEHKRIFDPKHHFNSNTLEGLQCTALVRTSCRMCAPLQLQPVRRNRNAQRCSAHPFGCMHQSNCRAAEGRFVLPSLFRASRKRSFPFVWAPEAAGQLELKAQLLNVEAGIFVPQARSSPAAMPPGTAGHLSDRVPQRRGKIVYS